MLQAYEGSLSFTTDAWTSEASHRSFVAFIVHLEQNGSPSALVLDVIEVAQVCKIITRFSRLAHVRHQNHMGVVLAEVFQHVLNDFGISHKILAITADNASNNETVVNKLEDMIPEFEGEMARACCFLHVINLVAKSLISQFDAHNMDQNKIEAIEAQGIAVIMGFEGDLPEGEGKGDDGDSENSWIDELGLLTAHQRADLDASIKPMRLILLKVRCILNIETMVAMLTAK